VTELIERLAHLDRVIRYGEAVLELGCAERFPASHLAPTLALSLLARSLEHARAIKTLTGTNSPIEARVICRCCLENCFVATAIAKKGEEFANHILDAARATARRTVREFRGRLEDEGRDPDTIFDEGLRTAIEGLQLDEGKLPTLNLKGSAESGGTAALYSIYRTLSEDSAHPSVSSLSRHTEIFREDDGNYKVILSDEPEVSEFQRCDTLDTAALALLGVAVSVRTVIGISGLIDEVQEIGRSADALTAKYATARDVTGA
jgi:hypothetical protein